MSTLSSEDDFDALVNEALAQSFRGWDFSWLRGRWMEDEPPWDYRTLVIERIRAAEAMLDMGTGGGEFLASLPARPPLTVATEAYPSNLPVARERLGPLGIQAVEVTDEHALALPDAAFDLVVNRHEYYDVAELRRVLRPGGRFLTQQVGMSELSELNDFLGAPPYSADPWWGLDDEVRRLKGNGFEVTRVEQAHPASVFHDVGAIVYVLKVIEWQVPDFSVERYRGRLLALHDHIRTLGPFHAHADRCLIEARRL
jgi:SAM-dependent methyltransferase